MDQQEPNNEPRLSDDENTEIQKYQKDVLLGSYQDVTNHARHAEMLRANAVNYGLLVASILITVIVNSGGKIDQYDLPLCIAVILGGLFTALFAASYAELYFRNRERAERHRKYFDRAFFKGKPPVAFREGEPPLTLSWLRNVDKAPYRFRWSKGITPSTHWFWIALPLAVFVFGIWLTVKSASTPLIL
jgi:hypothetical protein